MPPKQHRSLKLPTQGTTIQITQEYQTETTSQTQQLLDIQKDSSSENISLQGLDQLLDPPQHLESDQSLQLPPLVFRHELDGDLQYVVDSVNEHLLFIFRKKTCLGMHKRTRMTNNLKGTVQSFSLKANFVPCFLNSPPNFINPNCIEFVTIWDPSPTPTPTLHT